MTLHRRRTGRWLAVAAMAAAGGAAAWGAPEADRAAAAPAAAAAGTREMAALLQERAAQVDPTKLPFLVNDRRAVLFDAALRRPHSLLEGVGLRFQYAVELLNSGRYAVGLQALDAVEADVRAYAPTAWDVTGPSILLLRAIGHLRTAEEENCAQQHNQDSCLLPIQGQGVHTRREGSTRAVGALKAMLDQYPDHLAARWLLNVAHMTLGGYPEGVPTRYRIPPSAFGSEHPLPRFTNVAPEAGVDVLGLAGGAILDDFDNDGRLDLMLSAIGFSDQMRYLHNPGGGAFEDRTAAAGLTGEVGGLNLVHADYDNDGFLDVVVLRGGWMGTEGRFPLSLLRNNGDGTFADVTRAAGLLRFAPTQTAAWLDYDRDGWLDLFVGNESGPGDDHPCQLFRSNRNGTFTDVAAQAGVDLVRFVKGVIGGDYDNDGWPDLYVSIAGGDNVLFHNESAGGPGGGRRFADRARAAGVTEPGFSFGTFFFDYDNDGWLDLFVAGYGTFGGGSAMAESVAADYLGLPTRAERGRLYRNRGDGTFADATRAAGLYRVVPAMGLNFGDLDHDGFLDMYLGTGNPDYSTLVPNRMFRNDGGRRFQDVTTAGNFGHLQKGHAIAFGDVDNDGDQDVFAQMGGAYLADNAYSTLYQNPGGPNRWLGLELQGVRSNRSAVGARIEVAVEGPGGRRAIHRALPSGGSFGGSPFRQEIGLGQADRIRAVRITWPAAGGETQVIEGLEPGSWYQVREGVRGARRLERPRFSVSGKAAGPAAR